MKGEKGFLKLSIREEFINPLVIITKPITCEGRFSTFKACHFLLLSHFEFGKLINFPFYFWKILGKMASQVRKNVENLTHSLYHHGLIKMVVLAELKKKNQTWQQFLYELSNSHISLPLVNELSEPHILDPPDKAFSVNVSKDRTSVKTPDCGYPSHIQGQGIKNCRRAGRSNTNNPWGLKG